MSLLALTLAGVIELDPVNVTATREARRQSITPQAVQVISRQQLDESTALSTPDLLEKAVGLMVQKSNPGGGSPFLRGFTGKHVLILVDGVRVNNSFYRLGPHQYLNTLDPSSIERIEIQRGTGSVLYGTDALGGVINVITRKATATPSLRIETGFDSADNGSSVHVEGSALGVLAGGSFKQRGDLRGGGNVGKQVPTAYDEFAGHVASQHTLGSGSGNGAGSGVLGFTGQYVQQNDVPKTNEVVLGSFQQFNYAPQSRLLTAIDYQQAQAGAWQNLHGNLSFSRMKEGEDTIARATPALRVIDEVRIDTLGASLQGSLPIGTHRFTVGGEGYQDRYRTQNTRNNAGVISAGQPSVPDGVRYDSFGAYALADMALGQNSHLLLGSRYSRFNAEGSALVRTGSGGSSGSHRQDLALNASAVSNSAQVVVEITPQVQLIGGVAQGFRAPNVEDFFGRVDFGQEIPNLDLKPERSTERQIGLRYQQAGTFLEAVAYQSDYQGLIDRTNTMTINGIANVRQRRNLGRAELQGVEVQYQDQGQDRHQPWSWGAHATYTRGEDASGQPLRRIPPLAGHLWARYQASAKLWLEAGLNSSDRQDRLSSGDKTDPRICPNGNSTNNPCTGTAGFAVFSLRGGYRFYPQHWLLLRAENINDQRYKTHGSGVFNAGRSVQVGYRGVF